MGLYEDNIDVMITRFPELAEAVDCCQVSTTISVEHAYKEGEFLTIQNQGEYIALQSVYSPKYAAKRFSNQIQSFSKGSYIVLFGLGFGEEVRDILQDDSVKLLVVIEPLPDIARIAMEYQDLRDILKDKRFVLFLDGENTDKLKAFLYDHINLGNYHLWHYLCLPNYDRCFNAVEQGIHSLYDWMGEYVLANYNTICKFAKKDSVDSIRSFRHLIHAKSIYELKKYIQSELPCIIVGAGPSLNNNIQTLKKAKGKCLLICVDMAVKYCVSQGIIPDIICTIDPNIELEWEPQLLKVPLLVYTLSNDFWFQRYRNSEVLYFAVDSMLHNKILENFGYTLPCKDNYGSVSIAAFETAIALGFQNVILVGQDLAVTSDCIYAGEADEDNKKKLTNVIEERGLYEVEGYYGGSVYTAGDYYAYLEWYTYTIAGLQGQMIVNATEGGAKIPGTHPMPLEEALNQFCKCDFNFETAYKKIPYIIQNEADIKRYYELLKYYNDFLVNIKQRVYALSSSSTELQEIIDEIQYGPFRELFQRYMIQTIIDYRESKDIDQYLSGLREAVDYICGNWESMLKDIAESYTI